MGQTGVPHAEPEHNVTLTKGFYLGKYEVTQAHYEAVMTGNTVTDSNGNVISARVTGQIIPTVRWSKFHGMIFRYFSPV